MQNLPLICKEVALPHQTLSLFMPDPAFIQQAEAEKTYWARLWPAALVLARFIDEYPERVTGRHCLELGAGLGLPSFTAARYTNKVVASDIAAGSLAAMKQTRAAGGYTNVEIRKIDWTVLEPDSDTDLVLLSDVNYDPAGFEALSAALHRFLTGGKEILLATPQRLMAKSFLMPFMDRCSYHHSSEADGHAVSVFLLA